MSDTIGAPWLYPRSPLDDLDLPSGEDFALGDLPPAERYVFRGGEEARSRCSQAFGAELPTRLGTAAEGDERAALWLGPDEWLLIVEGIDPETFPAELARLLDDVPNSVVEISHRQVGFVVSGGLATRALNAGCPLDLRLSAFPVGTATRTVFDKAEIVLWRRAETEFRVEVWRSFAPYLVAALTQAAKAAPNWSL